MHRSDPGDGPGAPSQQGLRVLLIDDDEVDRARVLRALHPDHVVCEAATAAEGLECAENGIDGESIEVVLLDLRLPDADGGDLLSWFEERGIPAVMLTGVGDTAVVVDAMQRGALGYLVKGELGAAALERALRHAVETAALRRSVRRQREEIVRQRDRLAEQAKTLETANSEIRGLARALTLAEQAERLRISALLHDHVQQILFGAQIMLEAVRASPEAEAFRNPLTRVKEVVGEAVEATRHLALDLTPPVLESDDFLVALQWLGEHVGSMHDLAVAVESDGPIVIADREVRVLLSEAVRELLFNVVKHAGTNRARIWIAREGGGVTVEVSDEGRGFDSASAFEGGGFGLYSVRRRLELLGGQVDVTSGPTEGTRVVLRAPVQQFRSVGAPMHDEAV